MVKSSLKPLGLFVLNIVILSSAWADGLDQARTVLEKFQTQLLTVIPVVAVIALILLGVGYATNFVEKDTFVKWGIGLIIAGSATAITQMFFGNQN